MTAEKRCDIKAEILRLLEKGFLDSACDMLRKHTLSPDGNTIALLIEHNRSQALIEADRGEKRKANRLDRRARSLALLSETGEMSSAVIPRVVLPEGYCGKFLLASVSGKNIQRRTFLRSGDDWHREILRSFDEELSDYGFESYGITPQGGAFAEFEQGGTITLFGTSDDLGRCDMKMATELIEAAYPGRKVCH